MAEPRIGRVLRGDAKVVHVDFDGEVRQCAPRGKLFEASSKVKNPVAVGDFVRVSLDGDPPGVEEVLERKNQLSRVASSHDPREQVLFANVDQLFVVGSLAKPRLSPSRTDRILAACDYNEIPATLILNKLDLADEEELEEWRTVYASAGVPTLETCALDGRGVEPLKTALVDKVSVFYGASGAGKSSLLNVIQPELGLKVGKISKYWDAGKHTTTHSRMHRLDAGGWVIDTPGIRVFRLYDINRAELRDLFPEFAPYQESCRFPDCSHDHEPECGVYDAVEEGHLAPSRYASYLDMLEEIAPLPEDDTPVEPPEG